MGVGVGECGGGLDIEGVGTHLELTEQNNQVSLGREREGPNRRFVDQSSKGRGEGGGQEGLGKSAVICTTGFLTCQKPASSVLAL